MKAKFSIANLLALTAVIALMFATPKPICESIAIWTFLSLLMLVPLTMLGVFLLRSKDGQLKVDDNPFVKFMHVLCSWIFAVMLLSMVAFNFK